MTGQLEIFGPKADVIISSTNGLNCNGCSFINASGITLRAALELTPVI